jgi:hypothetical protein
MASAYLSFNLRMLNLVLGMCRGVKGLPTLLSDLGYQDLWVERSFRNTSEDEVKPELIVGSEQQHHTVLCEWKSGTSVDTDQLRRYAGVTQEDLRDRAFVPPTAAEQHDVAVFGLEEKTSAVALGVSEAGYSFPVLRVDRDGIALAANDFKVAELTRGFCPKLHIDMDAIPLAYVPFDAESLDWLVAQTCIQRIVELMRDKEPRLLLDDFVAKAYPLWHSTGEDYRGRLKAKVQAVLTELAQGELGHYLRWSKPAKAVTHVPTWIIQNNPASAPPKERPRQWKALTEASRNFVTRKQQGRLRLTFPE